MAERSAASSLGVRRPGWVDEFRAFIMRGNVVDLAVGIIIGVAFTAVVNSSVKDILTPIIGLIVGGIDFTNIFVTLKGPSEATLADAQKAGAVTSNFGVFLNAVIQFLGQLCGLLADQGTDASAYAPGAGAHRGASATEERGAARGDPRPPCRAAEIALSPARWLKRAVQWVSSGRGGYLTGRRR
jgi:large conductance mechanosensitive channel protein